MSIEGPGNGTPSKRKGRESERLGLLPQNQRAQEKEREKNPKTMN